MSGSALPLLLILAAEAAASPAPAGRCVMNHLKDEKSPYLLQHACNPVDWHPWGEEAFAKAKREDKPIFLSIGYSTCHWCHVMERESFSDAGIAAVLNAGFVPVKVDREERPDVDKIYMTAATGAGWGGGWPLSMWLTPEREPFFGGTYFPPDSRYGRPGFKELLERIAALWREDRSSLAADAGRLAEALKRHARAGLGDADFDPAWIEKAVAEYRRDFDAARGGFGGAPKFPMPVNQNLLLRAHARAKDPEALALVEKTLEAMAEGGLYDHVGGGFARYSTDAEWRVPHFEKMLYDNAQLAVNYLEAYQAGKRRDFLRVARETLDYVLRDMTHPEGGFHSAEDADSLPPEAAKGLPDQGHAHKAEGAFYLWTKAELDRLLAKEAPLFHHRFGVEAGGNAPADPHGEFAGKNILYAARGAAETARAFKRPEGEVERVLRESLKTLREARAKRPRPGLDDKVLASWNGLMISAFAKGAQVLESPEYLRAAQRAARFLRTKLYDEKTGRLYHRWRAGERAVPALADDYAFAASGLLDLYEASFEPEWLEWAVALCERLRRDFMDRERGGFYMTAAGDAPELLARVMADADNVEPSGSSIAALDLLRLDRLLDRREYGADARRTLKRFGVQLREHPRSLPQLLVAGDFASSEPRQAIIAGELGDPATKEMLRAIRAELRPGLAVMVVTEAARARIVKLAPQVRGMVPEGGKTTAYICQGFRCELPTSDPRKVAEQLGVTAR